MCGKKGFPPEQTIGQLREAGVLLSRIKGSLVAEACSKIFSYHHVKSSYVLQKSPNQARVNYTPGAV